MIDIGEISPAMRPQAQALVLAVIIVACSSTSLKLSVPRFEPVSSSLGSKVIFAGGKYDTTFSLSDVVDVCDQSKCTQLLPGLSDTRYCAAAATADSTAFIAGGVTTSGNTLNTIDLCTTTACTKASFTLLVPRYQHVGATLTTIGNKQYAFFASRRAFSNTPHASAEICDSTGCTSIPFSAVGFVQGAAASLGNYVIVAGGQVASQFQNPTYLTQVFKCDEHGCSAPYANGLSVGRYMLAAASVGSGTLTA